MADFDHGGAEQAPSGAGRVPLMTPWEKFEFWALPVLLALGGIGILCVWAFGLAEISVALLVNFHKYIHHLDRLKVLDEVPVDAAFTVVLSGALLVYPALVLRRTVRRKKETGGVLPQGEELEALRRKRKNTSLWPRLFIIGFFCLIAAGATHGLMTSPYRHILINWSFPGLFWLIAALLAVDGLFPSPNRAWTGFVATGAFGLLAILAVASLVRARDWRIVHWFFPLFVALFSAGLGIASIQALRRRRAIKGKE